MRVLDHDYADELVERLRAIPSDAKPAWGRLTKDGLVSHLAGTLRYSMGKMGPLPVQGGWVAQKVLAPLFVNGILRMPKNVQAPRPPAGSEAERPLDDLETLQALLEEYLQLVQAGELEPPPHPFFGPIGVDGWAKLHVAHFDHHLRQFRA